MIIGSGPPEVNVKMDGPLVAGAGYTERACLITPGHRH